MTDGTAFNPWRVFVGALVPAALLKGVEAPLSAKVLYALLMRHAGRNGYCWPHQAKLAEQLDQSERTIRRNISILAKLNLIRRRRQQRLGRGNVYEFLWISQWETGQMLLGDRPEKDGPDRMQMASAFKEEGSPKEVRQGESNTDHVEHFEERAVENRPADREMSHPRARQGEMDGLSGPPTAPAGRFSAGSRACGPVPPSEPDVRAQVAALAHAKRIPAATGSMGQQGRLTAERLFRITGLKNHPGQEGKTLAPNALPSQLRYRPHKPNGGSDRFFSKRTASARNPEGPPGRRL